MIRCLVFDVGNVLWRHKPPLTLFRRRHASLLGLKYSLYHRLFLKVYQDFETNSLDLLTWSKSINPQITPNQINRCLGQNLRPSFVNHYHNRPLLKTIKRLRKTLPVMLLSNTENYVYPYVHKKLAKDFDHSILSWQVGVRKPDPRIYQEIFKHGDWRPEDVLCVDDKPENISGAKSLGLITILYQTYPRLLSQLKKYLGSKI